jgi:thiol-disulfide isomerase/thioredoxin
MMSRSTLRNLAVISITTVVILGGLWLVQQPWKSSDPEAGNPSGVTSIEITGSGQAPALGKPAAEFVAFTVTGEAIALSDLKGKPVWLVFGATWCTNCRAEAPDVDAVAHAFEGRATVVSIYVGEPTATVQGYADRLHLTNPQIADTLEVISAAYAIMGIPAHYFIDSDGVIQGIVVGTLTQQRATEILNSLM